MSPEAFSDFARQQQFHKSLLERLYDMYPDDSPSKVMLCENYRANRAIVEFTSELFYDNKLKASKDPIAHSVYYPLTFFTARGEEVQHENSSGYFNTSEVGMLQLPCIKCAFLDSMFPFAVCVLKLLNMAFTINSQP